MTVAGATPGRQRSLRRSIGDGLVMMLITAVVCLVSEGIARLTITPRSSGIGIGILDARFRALHAGNHCNVPGEAAGAATTRILFVGDSFTKGQGVAPTQTFPCRVAVALGTGHAIDDIARDGADTRDETRLLAAALSRPGPAAALVVHQYFGNDIAYLVDGPAIPRQGWIGKPLLDLTKVSYLADYLYQPIFLKSFGADYVQSLFRAYRDDRLRAIHLRDLDHLWATAHAAGAAVLFVNFPFLNNHVIEGAALFDLSRRTYMAALDAYFLATCRHGDALLEVAALIATQPEAADMDRWIANRVDPHPSAALHELVAVQIIAFVEGRASHVEACPR
jgi:hypothetical protein